MLSLRCNSMNDCGDNSDEDPLMCSRIPMRQCTESEFKCRSGRCIRGDWKCDHMDDCQDNSDEQNCAAHDCGQNRFKCQSGHCIEASQRCDGIRNCLDLSDETKCLPRYPNGQYCLNTSFTCNNTFCIDLDWMCDGDNDCVDNSDEISNICSSYNCTKENYRFRCKSGSCVSISSVCNGFHDCQDGSDEDYTVNGPCKRQHVECESNEFKCSTSHRCIPVDYVCDKDLDCGPNDESDELGCFLNHDTTNTDKLTCQLQGHLVCEHNCTNFTENGFYCSCFHGFEMLKINSTFSVAESNNTSVFQRHICSDIDECESFQSHHCPQICSNQKGSYKCSCDQGYVDTHNDGSICEAIGNDDSIVLIAYGSEIRQIRPNFTDYVYNTLIEHEKSIVSIDIDPIDRYVYWIDETNNLIKRSYLPNSKTGLGNAQTLTHFNQELNSNQITAISLDWIAKNLYLADATNKSIKVAKNDGRYLKTIITEEADHIQSLIVNPYTGYIYWINNGNEKSIMSAWMNGENIRIVVNTNLASPTGLTIDFHMNNRLFWCDQKYNFIESIKYDGTDRVRIEHAGLLNPFRIDIFENHVYWLSKEHGSVNKIDKFGRGGLIKMISGLDLTSDIKVFHSLKIQKSSKLFFNINFKTI